VVAAESYADGTEWTQFAWQVSSDGGTNWFDVFNATTATLTVTTQLSYNGKMYRAAAQSVSGFTKTWHEKSEAATLTVVEAPTVVFTVQPLDVEVTEGENATFVVAAEAYADGTEWTQFAWQVSSDGGSNWFDVFNATTATLTVTTQMSYNGNMYRAAATSGTGFNIVWHEKSEAATLTVVEAPTAVFTVHPQDVEVTEGEDATFVVAAESYADGTEWTQFAWQQSADTGSTWIDVPGQTTNTMSIPVTSVFDGYLYRAAATSGSEPNITWHEFSDSAKLTVLPIPVYVLTFHVTDINGNIEGATITIEGGDLTTDVDGLATIELNDGDYDYSVVADGYDGFNGSVTIAGAPVTENIELAETIVYYMATFHVVDANGNIEGALINVDGTELTTDVDGIATIELADGAYDYIVNAPGYFDYPGTITVSGSAITETISLIIDGIEELNAANISIYPNPSNGVFFVDVDQEFSLSVIDVTGKVVYSDEIRTKTKIDLTNQIPGVYIFRLINDKNLLTYRVIVK
jgi:hypothetical protein